MISPKLGFAFKSNLCKPVVGAVNLYVVVCPSNTMLPDTLVVPCACTCNPCIGGALSIVDFACMLALDVVEMKARSNNNDSMIDIILFSCFIGDAPLKFVCFSVNLPTINLFCYRRHSP